MTHIRRTSIAAVAMVAATLAAGCQAAGPDTNGQPAPEITIGFAVSTLNNPFFKQLKEGAEAAAKQLGIKLVVTDAQDDAAKQVDQVQGFITQRVKAILINPVDSQQSAPAAKAADNAKIPLVAVDRSISGGRVASEVTSDNVEGGKLAAEALAKATGPGEILHLQGIPGTSASKDRGEGFEQGLALRSSVRIVARKPADFARAKGLSVATDLLQAKPGVKGLFAENDEMALGAIKALGDRAGKSVQVVGFDGSPDGLAAIESGLLAATIAQQPKELGKQAVEQAVNAVKQTKVRELVEIPVKVVTKDNVSEFKK